MRRLQRLSSFLPAFFCKQCYGTLSVRIARDYNDGTVRRFRYSTRYIYLAWRLLRINEFGWIGKQLTRVNFSCRMQHEILVLLNQLIICFRFSLLSLLHEWCYWKDSRSRPDANVIYLHQSPLVCEINKLPSLFNQTSSIQFSEIIVTGWRSDFNCLSYIITCIYNC